MLHLKDGRNIPINGVNFSGIINKAEGEDEIKKGDLYGAFAYGSDKISVTKTGAEIKALLATKKAAYESLCSQLMVKKSHYGTAVVNCGIPCTQDGDRIRCKWNDFKNRTDEAEKLYSYYDDICYKLYGCKKDLEMCDTITSMVADKTRYKLNIEQFQALTRAPEVKLGDAPSMPELTNKEEPSM